jgi:hypothetical protein
MTTQLPFRMSKHALERALEMNVAGEEIRACYERPVEMMWSQKYACWWFIRGRVTLSVTEDRTCVITVLWSNEHDWRADYARGGDLTGRERRTRTDMNHLPRRRA